MALPLYIDGAIATYSVTNGTIAPALTLSQSGYSVTAAVPETTFIPNVKVSGIYLVTLYLRTVQPASGGSVATPTSTIGPVTVYFTCADCLVPVTLEAGLLLQDGTIAPTNSGNKISACLSGSSLVNALAGTAIAVSIGYASNPPANTTTTECSATMTSTAWDALAIGLRSTVASPLYVGGATASESAGATTLTVTYTPTTGNAAVILFNTGASAGTVTVKDNLGNTLTAGPSIGTLKAFSQASVPAGVTSYTATWTTARQASMAVTEYSGATSVDIALAGNTGSGSSGTASLTITPDETTDTVVFGFGNVNSETMTGVIGNARQSTLGSASTGPVMLMDNTVGMALAFNYHLKAVFVGGLP